MKKINARECSLKVIDKDIEQKFLEANHDQGYAKSLISYGLFYDEELIQLMSFGKPRFNKNYQWELIRECSKKNFLIRGGSSKLWKHFKNNNSCISCICYHYPHNKNELYTNHLVENCDFKCIKKAKPAKKIYFEGLWNDEVKRIDKSILEKHGVDRLLNTDQGHDRSNEQILFDLGFEKKYEDGYSPQIDIFYPFGIVYRIDDLNDESFYIGMCEIKSKWDSGYLGSGEYWRRHLKTYPNINDEPENSNSHKYKRTILFNCKTPKETRSKELNEIKKYFKNINGKWIAINPKCCNTHVRTQGDSYTPSICNECGGKGGNHKKNCNKARLCTECGGYLGTHKNWCSKAKICEECGSINGQHSGDCSKSKTCSECGGKKNSHKKSCSKYKKPKPCSECGAIRSHKTTCSKISKCKECSGVHGNHKKTCSQYINQGKCAECGYNLKSRKHAPTCSHYKKPKICLECGGKAGHHKKNCLKVKTCHECGGVNGKHKTKCSLNTNICNECGGSNGSHFKNCSKCDICNECGGANHVHKSHCSKYKKFVSCEECGGLNNHHKKQCSKFKQSTICNECGGKRGKHKKICTQYKNDATCSECGGKNGKHYSTCSKYTIVICKECDGKFGHHNQECSKYKKKNNQILFN